MTRLLEQKQEEKQMLRNKEILAAVEFELVGAIAHGGGQLTGFSIKVSEVDCLLTLRAKFEGEGMVCFVGAPDIGDCLRKGVVEAYHNRLRWRADAYAR